MEEVIRRFNKAGVRYVLIGGQAVRSQDLDDAQYLRAKLLKESHS